VRLSLGFNISTRLIRCKDLYIVEKDEGAFPVHFFDMLAWAKRRKILVAGDLILMHQFRPVLADFLNNV
jgi:hypothetical protein